MLGVIFVMNVVWKKYFQLAGFSFAMGWSYLIGIIFFTAFFNPGKSVVIYINRFGEASLESVIVLVILFFCTIMFVWFVIDFVKEAKVMVYNSPKRDGSGRGVRANRGRNPACSGTNSTGKQ